VLGPNGSPTGPWRSPSQHRTRRVAPTQVVGAGADRSARRTRATRSAGPRSSSRQRRSSTGIGVSSGDTGRIHIAHRVDRRSEMVQQVIRLAKENSRWGYLRIVGELRKLGFSVSKTSVSTVLRQHNLSPAQRRSSPTWSQFHRSQAKRILATDFFHVDGVFFRRSYVLSLSSRLTVASCTSSERQPTQSWTG
jgi:hypothetical protein